MNQRSDLFLAFTVALAVHAAAGLGLAAWLAAPARELLPRFQLGESSVTLTLVPVPRVQPPPEPEPPPPPPPPPPPEEPEALTVIEPEPPPEPVPEEAEEEPEPEPAAAVPEEEPEPEPVPPEPEEAPRDADLQTKGVEGVVASSVVRPRYPLRSRLRGEEGLVVVQVEVAADGRAREVAVAQSSGHPALDRAAVKAAWETRFVVEGGGGESTLSFLFRLVD